MSVYTTWSCCLYDWKFTHMLWKLIINNELCFLTWPTSIWHCVVTKLCLIDHIVLLLMEVIIPISKTITDTLQSATVIVTWHSFRMRPQWHSRKNMASLQSLSHYTSRIQTSHAMQEIDDCHITCMRKANHLHSGGGPNETTPRPFLNNAKFLHYEKHLNYCLKW